MSIRRMSAVWEKSQHEGCALLFLLAVADYADDNGVAWPGYKKLGERTRVSRRHLTRVIDQVSESGEVLALNRRNRQSNIYIVTVGLGVDNLVEGLIRAHDLGAVRTRGSANLSIPPQVLGVVTGRPYLDPIQVVNMDPATICMAIYDHTVWSSGSLDPSLPIITREKDDLWETILSELKLQMSPQTFNAWLRGSRVTDADNGKWTVEVVSSQAVEWLNERQVKPIKRAMERHELDVALEFVARGG